MQKFASEIIVNHVALDINISAFARQPGSQVAAHLFPVKQGISLISMGNNGWSVSRLAADEHLGAWCAAGRWLGLSAGGASPRPPEAPRPAPNLVRSGAGHAPVMRQSCAGNEPVMNGDEPVMRRSCGRPCAFADGGVDRLGRPVRPAHIMQHMSRIPT
jgi:hypothetical protein